MLPFLETSSFCDSRVLSIRENQMIFKTALVIIQGGSMKLQEFDSPSVPFPAGQN